METCKNCGVLLKQDELALTRKLVSRASTEFFCKRCLGAHFDIPVEKLDEMVIYYRKSGCTLFS